jgi:hypothetical protein
MRGTGSEVREDCVKRSGECDCDSCMLDRMEHTQQLRYRLYELVHVFELTPL